MKCRWIAVALGVLVGIGPIAGQATQAEEQVTLAGTGPVPVLQGMQLRLRLALHVAILGVLAPTLADQRVYAGQLLNLLVGPGGEGFDPRWGPEERFTGLVPDARRLMDLLPAADGTLELRERAGFLARKVLLLVGMAREETVQALRARTLEAGAERLLRAFAFLYAALGQENDPPHLGGVLVLLRLLHQP